MTIHNSKRPRSLMLSSFSQAMKNVVKSGRFFVTFQEQNLKKCMLALKYRYMSVEVSYSRFVLS